MRLYIIAETDKVNQAVDYVEAVTKDGSSYCLSWDESEVLNKDGKFDLRCKGVEDNESGYMNDRIAEFENLDTIAVCLRDRDTEELDTTATITRIEFVDKTNILTVDLDKVKVGVAEGVEEVAA